MTHPPYLYCFPLNSSPPYAPVAVPTDETKYLSTLECRLSDPVKIHSNLTAGTLYLNGKKICGETDDEYICCTANPRLHKPGAQLRFFTIRSDEPIEWLTRKRKEYTIMCPLKVDISSHAGFDHIFFNLEEALDDYDPLLVVKNGRITCQDSQSPGPQEYLGVICAESQTGFESAIEYWNKYGTDMPEVDTTLTAFTLLSH